MFKDLPSQHKDPDRLWGRCAPCPCAQATSPPSPSACRPSPVQQRQRRADTPSCFPRRSVMRVRTSMSTSRVFTDVFLNFSWFFFISLQGRHHNLGRVLKETNWMMVQCQQRWGTLLHMSQISFSFHLLNILTVIIYIFYGLHIIIGMCVCH